jgi:heptosyltransferase III
MRPQIHPRKILVIKLRHIGDVLLVTPVFQSLRAAFPEAELHACVNERTDRVLTTNPLLKRVFVVQKTLREQARLVAALRREKFDLVLDFTGSDRSAILARMTGAPERWGYYRVKGFWGRNRLFTKTARRKKDVHVVEQQADLLQQMGIPSPAPRLAYSVREEDRSVAASLVPSDKPLAHLHPVSRLMVKTWPARFTAKLIDHLASRGLQPVVTASNDLAEVQWVNE